MGGATSFFDYSRERFQKLLRFDLVIAGLLALALIGLAVGLGHESNKLIPANPSSTAHYQAEVNNPLNFLAQWDGPIYLDIAAHGYTHANQTNFFPLYPLTVRVVSLILGSPLISALLVSWLSFLGLIYFYLKCLRVLYPEDGRRGWLRAGLLLVLFPTAIFFVATYTESLFCMLALGSIYSVLRHRWLAAGAFAGLASATHLNGLFIAFLAALLLWEARQQPWKCLLVLAFGAAGFLGYIVFLAIHFGDPLLFLAAQANHSTPHLDLLRIIGALLSRNGVFFGLLLVAAVYWWHKRRSFTLYVALYLCLIFMSSHGASGLGRYTLAVFPVPLMVYDYTRRRPLMYTVTILLSTIGWTYFAILYAAGYSGG